MRFVFLKKIHEKFVINYMVIRVKEKDSCSLIKIIVNLLFRFDTY